MRRYKLPIDEKFYRSLLCRGCMHDSTSAHTNAPTPASCPSEGNSELCYRCHATFYKLGDSGLTAHWRWTDNSSRQPVSVFHNMHSFFVESGLAFAGFCRCTPSIPRSECAKVEIGWPPVNFTFENHEDQGNECPGTPAFQ